MSTQAEGTLAEAIEIVELWLGMWEDEQADLDEVSECDEEERKVILAMQDIIKVAKSSKPPVSKVTIQDVALSPHWPEGLEPLQQYEFLCDDKGRDGGTWLRVMVANDGDVHVSMQDWEDIKSKGTRPHPLPSVRCRTHAGGGGHLRTRQALLWLAQAIRLDNADLNR